MAIGISQSAQFFPPLPERLAQGTWYVRTRAVDQYGVPSAWSATNTFTVQHVPSTSSRTPSSATSVVYAGTTSVTWAFGDPDTEDFQTKYTAELWKVSDPGGSLIASGEITSADGAHTFTIPDATWKDTELRWRVRVKDQDGVQFAWSPDQAFYLRDVPVAAVTSPTDGQILGIAQPTFTWTFSASGGRTQSAYRIVVTDVTNSNVIYDTGTVYGDALSHTLPSPIILPSASYTVKVEVTDSVDLVSSDTHAFTAAYTLPTVPFFSIDSSYFATRGNVFVDWSTAVIDPTHLAWRVYRRPAGTSEWSLLYEGADLSYVDYLCPAMTAIEYSVVQVAESFGLPVASPYPIEYFSAESPKYILVCPEQDALNLVLYHVTDDQFEDEQEMATLNLIGRGRRVEYGTRFGHTGTLTAKFRDNDEMTGRQQRLWLEALRDSGLRAYLRTPFGDVWSVALNSASIARTPGVGLQEMLTATITYTEITA